jgi:hypothetical protein
LPSLFHAICNAALPIPSQCSPVPAGFDEWFERAVARKRDVRFQNIKEAADALAHLCCVTNQQKLTFCSPKDWEATIRERDPAAILPESFLATESPQSLTIVKRPKRALRVFEVAAIVLIVSLGAIGYWTGREPHRATKIVPSEVASTWRKQERGSNMASASSRPTEGPSEALRASLVSGSQPAHLASPLPAQSASLPAQSAIRNRTAIRPRIGLTSPPLRPVPSSAIETDNVAAF